MLIDTLTRHKIHRTGDIVILTALRMTTNAANTPNNTCSDCVANPATNDTTWRTILVTKYTGRQWHPRLPRPAYSWKPARRISGPQSPAGAMIWVSHLLGHVRQKHTYDLSLQILLQNVSHGSGAR